MPSVRWDGQRRFSLGPLYTFCTWSEQANFLLIPRAERLRLVRTFFTHLCIPFTVILKICGYDKLVWKHKPSRALADFLCGNGYLGRYETKIFALYHNLRYHPEVLAAINSPIVNTYLKSKFTVNGYPKKGICPNMDRVGKDCNCENISYVLAPNQDEHAEVQELVPVHTEKQPTQLFEQLLFLTSNPQHQFDLGKFPEESIASNTGNSLAGKPIKHLPPVLPPPSQQTPIELGDPLQIEIPNRMPEGLPLFTCEVSGPEKSVQFYFQESHSTVPTWLCSGLLKSAE